MVVNTWFQEQEILQNARSTAERFVYSTCTLSPREELDLDGIRTFPHRDDTDGFFIARLVRGR